MRLAEPTSKLKPDNLVPARPSPRSEQETMQHWKGDLDKPVVSICCITYNHKEYISEAIDSFLMQETEFPFEILIHDDASTDGTKELIADYARKYPKLIKPIFQKENKFSQGHRPNWDFNFPRARGRYIALCEGDDYWVNPDKLQKQITVLESSTGVSLIGGVVSPRHLGGDFGKSFPTVESVDDGVFFMDGAKILRMIGFVHGSTFVFTKKLLEGLTDISNNIPVSGDLVLLVAASNRSGGVAVLPELCSVYRHHPGGIWSTSSLRSRYERYATTWLTLHRWLKRSGRRRYLRIARVNVVYFGVFSRRLSVVSKVSRNPFLITFLFMEGALARVMRVINNSFLAPLMRRVKLKVP